MMRAWAEEGGEENSHGEWLGTRQLTVVDKADLILSLSWFRLGPCLSGEEGEEGAIFCGCQGVAVLYIPSTYEVGP